MNAKEFVIAKFPRARCIRYKLNGGGGYNIIWELGRERGRRLASGDSAAGAWRNAKARLVDLAQAAAPGK